MSAGPAVLQCFRRLASYG